MDAAGISGGRLGSAKHRDRLVQTAADSRATVVLLLLGGNDLCDRDVDVPELSGHLVKLVRDVDSTLMESNLIDGTSEGSQHQCHSSGWTTPVNYEVVRHIAWVEIS